MSLMQKWKDAMRSGKYTPYPEALYGGNHKACCLGVAKIECFNQDFQWSITNDAYLSSNGDLNYLSPEECDELNLDLQATDEEIEILRGEYYIAPIFFGDTTREIALTQLNDKYLDYGVIIEVIERFGWDKSV